MRKTVTISGDYIIGKLVIKHFMDKINFIEHKIYHGLIGGTSSALLGKDFLSGFVGVKTIQDPPGFRTIDFYSAKNKTIISAKTLNTLTLFRINNPKSIRYTLNKYVKQIHNYKVTTLSGKTILVKDVKSKRIHIAFPR